ncbi:MAG TPA: hypothetical protein VKP13_16580 [Nitrospira sp.]|nr:hypothetical protein [Nitrospira sp.]
MEREHVSPLQQFEARNDNRYSLGVAAVVIVACTLWISSERRFPGNRNPSSVTGIRNPRQRRHITPVGILRCRGDDEIFRLIFHRAERLRRRDS